MTVDGINLSVSKKLKVYWKYPDQLFPKSVKTNRVFDEILFYLCHEKGTGPINSTILKLVFTDI